MKQDLEYADILRAEFIENVTKPQQVNQLTRELNLVESYARDYSGRELLEQLQNMDDAAFDAGNTDAQVLILLHGNRMLFCNQGLPFSRSGICSIQADNNSSKEEGNIGKKGVGFRALLNWTNQIKIYSGEFAIEFSQQYADEIFKQYVNNEQVLRAKQHRGNKGVYFPILSVPRNTTFPEQWVNGKYVYDGTEYDTCIECIIKESRAAEVRKLLRDFADNAGCLIFMQGVKTIKCIIDGEEIVVSAKSSAAKNLPAKKWTITKTKNDEVCSSQSYTVFQEDGIAIALPHPWVSDGAFPLYNYFPIYATKCDFPVIFHADKYAVSINRNELNKNNETNSDIARRQLMMLARIAGYFGEKKYGSMALEMVKPSSDTLMSPFNEFQDEFFEEISRQKIIPTITGKYLALADDLKYLEYGEIPRVFYNHNEFDNLVPDELLDTLFDFPKQIYDQITTYDEEELYNIINSLSEQWTSPDDRVQVFYSWKENFDSGEFLPKLLRDRTGNFFSYDSSDHGTLDFFNGVEITQLPDWFAYTLFDETDQEKLFEYMPKEFERSDKAKDRILHDHFIQDFMYYDRSTILPEINRAVGDDYNRALDFVNFLYTNYRNQSDEWTPPKDTKWNFPTSDGKVLQSKELFFDETYGNQIGATICRAINKTAFPEMATFSVPETDAESFLYLMKKFGVTWVPMPAQKEIDDKHLPKLYKDQLHQLATQQYAINIVQITSIETVYIEQLEDILKKAPMDAILAYLNLSEIKNHLAVHPLIKLNYTSANYANAAIRAVYLRDVNYDQMRIYSERWLEINDEYHAPRKCILFEKKYKNDNILAIPKDLLDNYADLFRLVGVRENISAQAPDVFYTTMMALPDFDTDGSISEKIYRELLKEDVSHLADSHCTEKDNFLRNGKLLAKNRTSKVKEFRPVSDVWYSSKKQLNIQNKWLLKVSNRDGGDDVFNAVFGIKPFKEKFKITHISEHPLQSAFEKDLNEFKQYLAPFGDKFNQEIKRAATSLRVTLIKDFELDGDIDTPESWESYCVIPGRNNFNWYIYIPQNQTELNKQSVGDALAEILNIIGNSGDNTDKISLLYFLETPSCRTKQLENWGCDLTVMDNQYTLQKQFIDVLREHDIDISESDIDGIDFSDLYSVDTIEKITELLKKYNLDFSDLAQTDILDNMNLSDYHKAQLGRQIDMHYAEYQSKLYNQLKDMPISDQEKFIEQTKAFMDLAHTVTQWPDSIYVDYYEGYIKPIMPDCDCCDIDIDDARRDNYNAFVQGKDPDSVATVLNNVHNYSLLLFGQMDELNNRYDASMTEPDSETKSDDTDGAQGDSGTRIGTIIELHTTGNTTSGTPHTNAPNNRGGTKRQAFLRVNKKAERTKEENGFDAEELVFNTLTTAKENGEICSLEWVSGNGAKAGYGIGDDTLGYDIRYSDTDHNIYFVEVKSASKNSGGFNFILSANEISVAQRNKASYMVMLVLPDKTILKISWAEVENLRKEIESQKCYVDNDWILSLMTTPTAPEE